MRTGFPGFSGGDLRGVTGAEGRLLGAADSRDSIGTGSFGCTGSSAVPTEPTLGSGHLFPRDGDRRALTVAARATAGRRSSVGPGAALSSAAPLAHSHCHDLPCSDSHRASDTSSAATTAATTTYVAIPPPATPAAAIAASNEDGHLRHAVWNRATEGAFGGLDLRFTGLVSGSGRRGEAHGYRGHSSQDHYRRNDPCHDI